MLTSNSGGAIPTVVASTMIDFLRNSLTLTNLGATLLTDLTGNLSIPKQTAAAVAGWAAEGVTFGELNPRIGQISLSPKRVGTYVEFSRTLSRQSSEDVEALVRRDLAAGVAIGIDRAGIAGSGVSPEPEGILTNPDIPVVSLGTNGGALTWAKIVAMESAVETSNALTGTLAYLTSVAAKGAMKTAPKEAGLPIYLWDEVANTVNGYRAIASSQVPSNLTKGSGTGLSAAIFGDFSAVYIATWGGAIITVNPYSGDREGLIRLVIEQHADVAIRHAESFSIVKDIVTA